MPLISKVLSSGFITADDRSRCGSLARDALTNVDRRERGHEHHIGYKRLFEELAAIPQYHVPETSQISASDNSNRIIGGYSQAVGYNSPSRASGDVQGKTVVSGLATAREHLPTPTQSPIQKPVRSAQSPRTSFGGLDPSAFPKLFAANAFPDLGRD